MTLFGKAFAVWLLILVFAVLNGTLREMLLIPFLGRVPGLVASGVMLMAVIFLLSLFSVNWLRAKMRSQLVFVGAFWLLLTLIFEFGFGFLRGLSLSEILAAYAFTDGNLWSLVLVFLFFAPSLAAVFSAGRGRRLG